MGPMVEVVLHDPLAAGGADAAGEGVRRLLHAHVWAWLEIAAWGERRELHAHLVALPDEPERWAAVDLSRVPLRPADGGHPPLPEPARRELLRHLEGWRVELWRAPAVGLVSEPGEGRAAFRSRVLGMARPALQRSLDGLPASPRWTPPWRRRAAGREARRRREALAASLHRLAEDLERVELAVGEAVRCRAELGWLVLPSRLELPAAGPVRDPMIAGPVRGGAR